MGIDLAVPVWGSFRLTVDPAADTARFDEVNAWYQGLNTTDPEDLSELFNMTELIVFEVDNYTDRAQFESFQATARELLECNDIEARYFEVLASKAANPVNSGLGLLTIVHDFNARIGVRFTETDAETCRVSLQVIVRPEELME